MARKKEAETKNLAFIGLGGLAIYLLTRKKEELPPKEEPEVPEVPPEEITAGFSVIDINIT